MACQSVIPAGELLTNYALKKDNEVTIEEVLNPEHVTHGKTTVQLEGFGLDCTDSESDKIAADGRFSSISNQFEYIMTHPQRGCFIIFNQEVFECGIPARQGTDVDARNLFVAATKMGFEYVRIFRSLTKEEILNWVNQIARASHASYDCFGCAFLSHGSDGDVVYAKDGPIYLSQITSPFSASNCPTLAGKPKLFFVQACRGNDYDKGAQLQLLSAPDMKNDDVQTIPNEADFLLAYSTIPGYVAWLNSANGSWFVQALSLCIDRYHDTMDFLQIMTRVNRMVAFSFESSSAERESNHFKQMPSIVSRLTADLYFGKRRGEPSNGIARTNGHTVEEEQDATHINYGTDEDVITEVVEKHKNKTSVTKWLRRSLLRRRK